MDILAKAENGIKIRRSADFNVFRAIPNEFKGFPAAGADIDQNRKHARELVKAVLGKSDGIFRPIF